MTLEIHREDDKQSLLPKQKPIGPVIIPQLRQERSFRTLPNGVVEVIEGEYAMDKTSASGTEIMRADQSSIESLPLDQRYKAFCQLSSGLAQFAHPTRVASYWDLEDLYTFGNNNLPGKETDDNPEKTNLWYRCFENARAVRERAEITRALLIKNIFDQANLHPDENIEVFSIASGSARFVLEALEYTQKLGIPTRARLLDLNIEALEYSKKLAEEMGLVKRGGDIVQIKIDKEEDLYQDSGALIELMQGHVININPAITQRLVHVVEAVGINDYLLSSLCVGRFFPAIYGLMAPGGTFIASNIRNNDERAFLHEAIRWPEMHYRDSEEFSDMFLHQKVGFKPENCKLHINPNGIYGIMEAKKAA